jgi:hypothetical protein
MRQKYVMRVPWVCCFSLSLSFFLLSEAFFAPVLPSWRVCVCVCVCVCVFVCGCEQA